MEKTVRYFYDLIVSVKEGKSELDGLTPLNDSSQNFLNDNASGSRLAIWRMWAWIMAVLAWLLDTMFDNHKKEVQTLAQSLHYGTLRWYHRMALAFQFGDSLIWNGHQYIYPALDPAKQIVKRAAVMINENVIQFKVATLDSNGLVVKLDNNQENAFKRYIDDLAYPGTHFVIITQDPDMLRLDLRIYYDELVFNADGSLIADSSVFPVKDAVSAFVSSLPFNGRMNIQRLIDAVQAVPGVLDLVMDAVEARYGAIPYSSVEREYIPFAGHMILDEENSNIQYLPYE